LPLDDKIAVPGVIAITVKLPIKIYTQHELKQKKYREANADKVALSTSKWQKENKGKSFSEFNAAKAVFYEKQLTEIYKLKQ
jgi:hypothetical protein